MGNRDSIFGFNLLVKSKKIILDYLKKFDK